MRTLFAVSGLVIFFFSLSVVWADEPPPSPWAVDHYYQSRGFNPPRENQSLTLDEYIDPLTGNLFLHQIDFYLPGKAGLDLTLIRNYNARIYDDAYPGLPIPTSWVGRGWSFHLGKLYYLATKSGPGQPVMVLELPDGSRHNFWTIDGNTWISRDYWKITRNNTEYTAFLKSGFKYVFSETLRVGYGSTPQDHDVMPVKYIKDPNGNTITVTYQWVKDVIPPFADSEKVMTLVSDASGRTVVFYPSKPPGTGGVVLDSIRANNVTRMRFWYHPSDYVGFSLLDSCQNAVGLKWKYLYSNNAGYRDLLESVERPNERYITAYYWGMNSYHQSGVDFDYRAVDSVKISPYNHLWRYQYGGDSNGDSTVITAPDGSKTAYRFFGYRNPPAPDSNWKVGTLLSKRYWNSGGALIQYETYTWVRSSAISADPESCIVTHRKDDDIWVPLLSSKAVYRGVTYVTNYGNYDAYGNCRAISEAGDTGRAVIQSFWTTPPNQYIVDRLAKRTVTVGSESFTDSLGYNTNGNLTARYHYGVLTTYNYNSDGTLASEKDARNKVTSFSYGNPNFGIPRTITYPVAGVSVTRTLNWEGTIASQTDARGNTTRFRYDPLNRLTWVVPPQGDSTHISYDNSLDRWKTYTRGNGSVTYTYDFVGRLMHVENSEGVKEGIGWDNMGRKTWESFPYVAEADSVARAYTYDGFGRVVRVTNPDNSYVENTYTATTVDVRNERGLTSTYRYYAFGDPDGERWLMRVIQPVHLPNGLTTLFDYNAVGRLKKTTQQSPDSPSDLVRTYIYNTKNFLTGISTPEAGAVTYGYDAVGNVVYRKAASGDSTAYTYDALNRLTNIDYPGGATYDVTFQYDNANNRTRMAGARDTLRYYYDQANRDTCEAWKIDGRNKKVNYRYDGHDNVNRITYPSGRIVNFNYDSADRLVKIPSYADTVLYHPSGRENSVTIHTSYPRTLSKVYDRNSHRLTSLRDYPWYSDTLTYDVVGNVTDREINIYDGHHFHWECLYDSLDRLTSATRNGSNYNRYTYDDFGNRLTYSYLGPAWDYVYDAQTRRLTTVIYQEMLWRTYTYDPKGNPLTMNTQGVGLDSLFYDPENRLVTFKQKARYMGQDNIFRHTYQGDGLKVKTYREFPGPFGIQQDSIYYFYDRAGRVLEDSVTGGMVRDFIFLNGQLLAVSWRTSPTDTGRVFYECDPLGTPLVFINSGANMAGWASYYPFGERLDGQDTTLARTYRFTGKERDTTGMDYFGARWYDSKVGRFITLDPLLFTAPGSASLSNPQRLNPYNYVLNNPLAYVDRNGFWPYKEGQSFSEMSATLYNLVDDAWIKTYIALASWETASIGSHVLTKSFDKAIDNKGWEPGEAEKEFTSAIIFGAAVRILPYAVAQKFTVGKAHLIEAHKILEGRHLQNWRLEKEIPNAPSIIMTHAEHQAWSNKLAEELPYGTVYTKEQVWGAYQKVYGKHSDWLKAIEKYFQQ